ncbi:MAG: hypothetical protein LH469_01300 [Frankiaceae bacterium]|nr:hypothetical protein [Frankiaceae bacterium]
MRAVPSAPRRLRVVGGSQRLRWWHGRLTLGLTLTGAMVGALAGVVQAVLAGSWVPVEALESYGAGAGAGASAGLVLGLLLGLVVGPTDRYVLPQVVAGRPLWVQHRNG